MNRVEVETVEYEFAHGRSPRGRGGWMFAPERNTDCMDPRIFTVCGTYGEAKRGAKKIAAERGWPVVYVMS